MKRRWTPSDDATLTREYAQRGRAGCAALLGRSPLAIKTRALLLGLGAASRFWTADEEHQLQALLAEGSTIHAAARALGRSYQSTYTRAVAAGYRPQRRVLFSASVAATLRARNAAGYSDSEIAEELGCERHTVHDWREKLGLAPAGNSPRRRARVAAKTRDQLQRAGLASIGCLRAAAFARWAVAQGWPADTPPRCVQILNLIWERGPMTRREVAAALGLPWKGIRKTFAATSLPGGSWFAVLLRRGLLVSFRRVVNNHRKGGNTDIYSLADGVQRGPIDPTVVAPLIARGVRRHAKFNKQGGVS